MAPLPELAGTSFRLFAGPSDYAHLARIVGANARGEENDRFETADALASHYEHLERCDKARDLLVAEVDSTPVGYTRVWWDPEPAGPHIYRHVGFLDPEFGRRGIGTALFQWNEARLREIAAEHEAEDKRLEMFANDRNAGATELARQNGYRPETYMAEMIRPTVDDLPDHRLPEGVEIRPVTSDQMRTIWEADMEAFRDHWGYVEPTEAAYRQFLDFAYNDPSLWKIAWDDQGVAGQVKSFINTAQNEEYGCRRGWTEAISTARRWRRRGVAKALIVESIRELAKRGMTEVALGVHTENPNGAYDLYLGLGYEIVATWTTYRKPL
jgi:GNAT superfamily N-acetyltransferase